MNGNRLDALLDDIPNMALRAEVREFARMEKDEQLVHLYVEVKSQKSSLLPNVVNGLYTTGALMWLVAGMPRPW